MAPRSEWDEEASPSPGRNPRNNPKRKQSMKAKYRQAVREALDELASGLTAEEVGMLVLAPYSAPVVYGPEAGKLIRLGLLERQTQAKTCSCRATRKGAELVHHWAKRHTP